LPDGVPLKQNTSVKLHPDRDVIMVERIIKHAILGVLETWDPPTSHDVAGWRPESRGLSTPGGGRV
jgi:hypothetical protein